MSADLLSPEEVRVVLLGLTGDGKSSLGNTLLCRDSFQVCRGFFSGTQECQFDDKVVDDKLLQVTDTPGLMDTHKKEDDELKEVAKTIAISSPGPHVALLVICCDKPFSISIYRALCMLKTLFGPSLYSHSIVIFTFIDELTRDPDKRQSVMKEQLQRAPENLKKIISACSDRCFAVDNRASREDREEQSKQLLGEIMNLMRANGGKCLQNCMYKEVSKRIDKLTQEYTLKHKSTPVKAARAIKSGILDGSVQLDVLKPIVKHLYYKKVESRVVLLGKTGVGKSALGNILLGQDDFKVEGLFSSTTAKCQSSETKVEDIVLQVTDTPGLCDTQRPYRETLQEFTKCLALTSPGPHVVLMVFRCDVKFTKEEYFAYQILKEMYEGAIGKHMILVFTRADHLPIEEGKTQTDLERCLRNSNNRFLDELLADCSWRYFAVENRAGPEDLKKQRANLLTLILTLFRQNGRLYFDNENFREISEDVERRILTHIMANNVTGEVATRTMRGNIEKEEICEILSRWVIIVTDALKKIISQLARRCIDVIKEEVCRVM